MNRLRNRLIVVFLAATIVPLIVTGMMMSSLIDQSLSYTTTEELDRLSQSLETTGRDYYQQAREALQADAGSGALTPRVFSIDGRQGWSPEVDQFWESGEPERFVLAGEAGDRLEFLVRGVEEVKVYSRSLGNVHMNELTAQIRDTRRLVERANERDLRRGITTVLLILIAAVWAVSFASLIYIANRMSRPIQQLTTGLAELSSGNLEKRIESNRRDEIGSAIKAFNRTAEDLQQGRDRLVYLTQIASWQMLARKMAHELKNSLTPIRLTVEEIRARQAGTDSPFMERAVQIVTSEVESLERRVKAFSEFSSEPAIHLQPINLNEMVEERVAFLKPAHPQATYNLELNPNLPAAFADSDRVKGILTNLLENAAQAAPAGTLLIRTGTESSKVFFEIHDSGPGLGEEARRTLFEPTITFKDGGMGLGLSIARKNALVCAGDLALIPGVLNGAAFRLILPARPVRNGLG